MDGSLGMSSMLYVDDAVLPIRLQALESIDEILGSTVDSGARVREALRRHVQKHPGQPQLALLMHMLTVRPTSPSGIWNSHFEQT